jgi:glycogen synthase
MKILLTADPIGGVWNYALELCAALQPLGVRVHVATLGRALNEAQHAQIDSRSNVTLHESTFRLEWMQDPWDDLEAAGDWLLTLERELRPDVIHLNHLVHAALPWRTPVLSVGHSCVLSWWRAVHGAPAPEEWNTYRERVTASLQAACCVIAPSYAMLASLLQDYGPFQDAAVIHNARAGGPFKAGRKERLVLCAGRLWDEAKNVAALAAVAPRMDAVVAVAGESLGAYGNRMETTSLQLLGSLHPDALASWYAKAAIYALPARYEPFGLTALEAALSGCALVLGDIPSLQELWGTAACYVPPDDHQALEETLTRLVDDELLRARMAARAMSRARQFTPQKLAREYMNLYRQLQCDSRCSTTP